MNGLEDRLRRGLDSPLDVEPASALVSRVAAGARRRRKRRTAAMVAGAAATVAAVALGGVLLGGPDSATPPQPAPAPPNPPAGVVDVAVPDAGHVFALTADEGSTVWLWSGGGTWQRLHDFKQPVEYVEFAPDATNGWAWGQSLFSTHDGGQTWTRIENGPGTPSDSGHWVHLTPDRAWSLHETMRGLPEPNLLVTPVSSDTWSSVTFDTRHAVDIETVGVRVVVESATEGAGQVTLQSSIDGQQWTSLDLPCPGENQPYPAATEVFVLCPAAGSATVYRSVDLASWQVFGRSDLTAVTAVLPLSDDRLLLVGEPTDLLVTPSGSQRVDVGLRKGEEIFQGTFGTAGDTTYAVTSEHRILVSTDAGANWSALD